MRGRSNRTVDSEDDGEGLEAEKDIDECELTFQPLEKHMGKRGRKRRRIRRKVDGESSDADSETSWSLENETSNVNQTNRPMTRSSCKSIPQTVVSAGLRLDVDEDKASGMKQHSCKGVDAITARSINGETHFTWTSPGGEALCYSYGTLLMAAKTVHYDPIEAEDGASFRGRRKKVIKLRWKQPRTFI